MVLSKKSIISLLCLASLMVIQSTSSFANVDEDMEKYYRMKKKNHQLAKNILGKVLQQYPKNFEAQEEMGYLLTENKEYSDALPHFLIAENLTPKNYEIKSQIADLYNKLGFPKSAFYKYAEASHSPDEKIKVQAKKDMVDLAGQQLKIFPDPYFADVYFSPYYLPRFKDFIRYGQLRFGRDILPKERLQVYGTVYYNSDSRSNMAPIPSIYGDNYTAIDGGVRFFPFPKIPLYAYLEYGTAFNRIPDPFYHQTSTQYDLRGGFDYYNDWGPDQTYADKVSLMVKPEGSIYADFSYYSRFVDWIGQYTLRPGFRLLAYKYTSISTYWKVNGFVDTRQFFYNNAIETGPCIDIVPYNLVSIHIRLEYTKGYYLPVHSPEINTYGPNYNSSYYMVEGYLKF